MKLRLTLQAGQTIDSPANYKLQTEESSGDKFIEVDVLSPLLRVLNPENISSVSARFDDARILSPRILHLEGNVTVAIDHETHYLPTADRYGMSPEGYHSVVNVRGPSVDAVLKGIEELENKLKVTDSPSYVFDSQGM